MALSSFRTLACSAWLAAAIGCSGGAESDERFLSIGTAPPGGAFFVVGGAIADVLTTEGNGFRVTAEATKGSQESIRRIDRGEIELALSNAAITYFAVGGSDGWERTYPMRGLMTLADNVMVVLARKNSGIATIEGLRGRRVVVGVAGAGWEFFMRPILRAHRLGYQDFTPLNATQAGAVDMLADGSADAAFLGGALPTAAVVQATSSGDVIFIPFDAEAKRLVVSEYPFFFDIPIPAGTYRGQDEVLESLNFGSMHLIVHEVMDTDLAYRITKTIYENRDRIVAKHPAGNFSTAENVVRDVGTPFHPGAVRYYREIGIWPESR